MVRGPFRALLSPLKSFGRLEENGRALVLVIGEIEEEQERFSIQRGDRLACLGRVQLYL